jgi:hypothetical protein
MKKIHNQNINLKWFLEKKLKKKIQKKHVTFFFYLRMEKVYIKHLTSQFWIYFD